MKKTFYILGLLLSTFPLFGQATTGYHRVGQVIARGNSGTYAVVVPFASISVTNTGTGAGATIYSDPLLSSQISPPLITADMSGNYGYYMPLNTCVTENISGPGMGNIVIPNICGNPASTVTLQTNGTNNGSQTLLNLVAGTGVVLSNTGGNTTISASGTSGVTSINTVPGAFSFTGPGVSCSGTTCSFPNASSYQTVEVSGSPLTKRAALNLLSSTGISAVDNAGNGSSDVSLLQATSSQFGAVKVDGTTITAATGVISASGTGIGAVLLSPSVTQVVTQPSGTTLDVNNLNNVQYFWTGDISAEITNYLSACQTAGISCDAVPTVPYTTSSTIVIPATLGTGGQSAGVGQRVLCSNSAIITYTGSGAAVQLSGGTRGWNFVTNTIKGCTIRVSNTSAKGITTATGNVVGTFGGLILGNTVAFTGTAGTSTGYGIEANGDSVTVIMRDNYVIGFGTNIAYTIGVSSGPNAWVDEDNTTAGSSIAGTHVFGTANSQNIKIINRTSEGDVCPIFAEFAQDLLISHPYIEAGSGGSCSNGAITIGTIGGTYSVANVTIDGGIISASGEYDIRLLSGSFLTVNPFVGSGAELQAVQIGVAVDPKSLYLNGLGPGVPGYDSGITTQMRDIDTSVTSSKRVLQPDFAAGNIPVIWNMTRMPDVSTSSCTVISPEAVNANWVLTFNGSFQDSNNRSTTATLWAVSAAHPTITIPSDSNVITFSLNGSNQVCGQASAFSAGFSGIWTLSMSGFTAPTYEYGPIHALSVDTPQLNINGSQNITGVQGTTGAKLAATTGSFTNGHIRSTDSSGNEVDGGAPATGSVTSVTFTGDGIVLSSTPSSAVTTTGTLTAALANAAANTVLAGPASGGSAAPTYQTAPTISAANMTNIPACSQCALLNAGNAFISIAQTFNSTGSSLSGTLPNFYVASNSGTSVGVIGYGTAPTFTLMRSGGTAASQTALPSANSIALLTYQGWDGSAWGIGTRIQSATLNAWTTSDHSSILNFATVPSSSTTVTNRVSIGAAGGLYGTSTTGGDEGANTANMHAYYQDGVLLNFETTGVAASWTGVGGTTVICANADGSPISCTSARGSLQITGGTATTGSIAAGSWTSEVSSRFCVVTQNGNGSTGTTSFDLGHTSPSVTGFSVTAGITVLGATIFVDYVCSI